MTQPKRHFIDSSFGQIHVRVARPETIKAPPLLCFHMFPQSGRNFEKFAAAASTERVVVAPDFPGHGESDPPSKPITASDYAQSMWETVDALQLTESHGHIDLFGIHAGAKLATEFTRQRPDSVRKIVLSSAAVLFEKEVAALKKSFSPIPLDEEGTRYKALWKLLLDNRGPNNSLSLLATSFAEMLRGGETYEWGHHAVFDYNLQFPDVIKSLPHCITLLNPKDDLYAMTPRTLEYLQNGTLIDKPEWGHGFLEAEANQAAALINEILN